MVSGIGPQAALQELGIPIIANLSGVGQNIWVRVGLLTHTYLQHMAQS